jgi:hypothetical protein
MKRSEITIGIDYSVGKGRVLRKDDGRLRNNLSHEQRSLMGRKGGKAVARNREHMSAIGQKGGRTVSSDRQHMAAIARLPRRKRNQPETVAALPEIHSDLT